MTVTLGIDRLLAEPRRWLPAGRVALLTNQAALTSSRLPTIDALQAALGERLTLLLSPEHGLSGLGEDAAAMPDTRDPHSRLPVASLYGPRRRPDPELLAGIDAVVVDLPDVGVRCYTYATSVALLLEAARESEVQVVVCDRPSLLGPAVDGPALEPARRSFLGYLQVPFQHGLTLGELMRLHAHRSGGAPLSVVALEGWRRDAPRSAEGFVPPSPGLPTAAAVALYPGLVAFEGTGLSEGRGTPLPFQLVGGPDVDGHALAAVVGGVPGVWARPLAFRPESGKLAGRACGGVQLHLDDAAALRPLTLGVRLLQELRRQRRLEWRACADMPWGARAGGPGPAPEAWLEPVDGWLVDALLGDASLRDVVDGRLSLPDAERAWLASHRAFLQGVEPALLYPGAPVSAVAAAAPRAPLPTTRIAGGRGAPAPADRSAPLALGIDAGASSTRWRLEGPAGEVAAGRLAPLAGHLYGDAGRAGADELLEELAAAVLTAAKAQPGPPPDDAVRPASHGPSGVVAGVTGLDPAGAEARWLHRELASRLGLPDAAVTLLDDIELAFRCAFPEGDGVLVYAGTGSIAVCRGPDGERLRAGGHGFLIDDDGGGFSIGRAALRAVLRSADEAGLPPDTPLARRVYAVTGGSDWRLLRAYVYGGGRAAVAALAPAVASAAADGDGRALAILGWAGEELARLARVLLGRRGEPGAVALAGGVGRLGGAIEAGFRRALGERVSVRVVGEEPVVGAARMALAEATARARDGG